MTVSHEKHVRQPRKIRYTEAEWAAVVERARAAGRFPARYLREVSLGASPRVRRTLEHDEIVHELGGIGTALSRLATAAKEIEFAPQKAHIEGVLAEVLTVVRRLA